MTLIAVHCVDYQWDVILKFVSYVDSLTRSVKAVNEMSKNENLLQHFVRSLVTLYFISVSERKTSFSLRLTFEI